MFALTWPYSFSPSARLNSVFCPWGLITEFYTDLLSSAGIILSMCSRLDVEMAFLNFCLFAEEHSTLDDRGTSFGLLNLARIFCRTLELLWHNLRKSECGVGTAFLFCCLDVEGSLITEWPCGDFHQTVSFPLCLHFPCVSVAYALLYAYCLSHVLSLRLSLVFLLLVSRWACPFG